MDRREEKHIPKNKWQYDKLGRTKRKGLGLKIKQYDVRSTYLYGQLEEVVCTEQPPGFEEISGKICRLKKSIYYGLP